MSTQAPSPRTDTEPPPANDQLSPGGSPRLKEYDEFVKAVRDACGAPGTQQALRRALGRDPEEVPARTHAALMRPGLLPYGVRGARRRAYYTVAALIAARPSAERLAAQESEGEAAQITETATDTRRAADEPATGKPPAQHAGDVPASGMSHQGRRKNLGESLALAVARQGEGIKANGAESRLHLMVRQDSDGLHRMLPGVLRLLGSAGVPVDYSRLLNDLLRWERWQEDVVVEWLESYYRTLRRAQESNN
ncbi:type I-E CRISPR-associated protein Cse2/CasB [Streptomyces sp. ISL-99]|uniref:type I-E CRISPR-associated protein Cse2/CasB n=1 Tax=Streptomyces sp. ISL-99 TaxID=2819193 RepID=UPI001BECB321|nr:type I-E CRISPR-associated protein Cse2/CasB [Streptomyces sp. ISL-99]MBT2526316.1 type I-E CRISPR-associated protein Cse2/CasB [Streptomyces sp. ISL-99]